MRAGSQGRHDLWPAPRAISACFSASRDAIPKLIARNRRAADRTLYNGSHMEYQTWESVPLEVMSDMISRKVISGDKAMVAQVFLKKGTVVPEHHHESEQITYILEGALKFEIQCKEIVVGKGEVLRIPSNV